LFALTGWLWQCCLPATLSSRGSSHPRSGTPTFSKPFPYVTARRKVPVRHPPDGRRASLPEPTSPAVGGLRGPDPDLMAPDARRAEVAAILAIGFLRSRLRHVDDREILLDVLPRPSDE